MDQPATTEQLGKASLLSLPTEVLEHILEEVYVPYTLDNNEQAIEEAIQTLLAVMQTCHVLLDVGRAILYCQPRLDSGLFWSASFELNQRRVDSLCKLVEAIDTNRDLGALVQDLSCLDQVLDPSFALHREDQILAFQASQILLSYCSNVKSVAVCLKSLEQAAVVGKRLANLLHLASLSIYQEVNYEEDHVCVDTISACLDAFRAARHIPRSSSSHSPVLFALRIGAVPHHHPNQPCEVGPLLYGLASHLDISCYLSDDPSNIFCFLPRLKTLDQTPAFDGLASVSIVSLGHLYTLDCMPSWFVGHNALEDVTIKAEFGPPAFSFYEPAELDFRQELLTAFPNAHRLRFTHGLRMSLEKLQALATASPLLECLDLEFTLWSVVHEEFLSPDPNGFSSFEKDLIRILEQFKHLRKVDLGRWAIETSDPSGYLSADTRPALFAWAHKHDLSLKIYGCAHRPNL
ncbi:hypothetical protein JCM10908_000385 [Rhodotorula pacifica]|uniref:uncharacterized protein n=1 Tax=Rhodotorula pacifica TaxID=1495444 RepID=UPI00317185F8